MASRKELTNGKYIDDQMGNGVPEGGTTGQVLRKSSNADYDVEWGVGIGGGVSNGNITGTGVATRVAFWSGTSVLSSNTNLYWDNVNSRLGIGTATPGYKLDVNGNENISGKLNFTHPNNATQIRIGANGDTVGGLHTGGDSVIIGSIAGNNLLAAGGTSLVAVGRNAGGTYTSGGTSSVHIGRNSGSGITTGSFNTHMGMTDSVSIPSNTSYTLHLIGGGGYELNNAATVLSGLTSNYAMIGGGYNYASYINDFYFGAGPFVTVPSSANLALYAPSGTGTDIVGSNFTLNAGRGTGTGTPGDFIIKTSTALTSGSTLQTLTERFKITGGTGAITVNNLATGGADQMVISDTNGKLKIQTIPSSGLFNSDIIVSLSGGKTLGRYTTGQTIPSNGLSSQAVVTLLAQEALAPTLTLTSSTTIAFNQTAISNVLNFTKTINSLGASVSTVSLEWRRNNTGSWTVLSTNTALTTYTHSLTDSAFNTQPFNYRYIVVDTAGGTATATLNITPASYVAPSISFSAPAASGITSPETNTNREWGNTPSSLQGSWTRNSANVPVSSYTYSVSVNSGSYTTIGTSYSISGSSGSFASVSNTQATSTTTSIIYRVQVVDSFQTTTATYSINLSPLIFYGEINVATTINSAAIRALPSRKFANDGVNPFTFSSGTTNRRWLVAMNNTYSLSSATDITQNVDLTSNFAASSLSVNDFAGNARTYNLYNYTNAIPYNPAITIRITYI